MFGKNPIKKQTKGDGAELHLVRGSPFLTIQGEGPYAGHPAVFVRLHGCNLRCWFCDTEFSDPGDPIWRLPDLVKVICENPVKLVVITGGEPMRQNIVPLCQKLYSHGRKVQIETAGTLWLPGIEAFAEIVVSPKTPGIDPFVYRNAIAFKYVVNAGMLWKHGVPCTQTQRKDQPATALAGPRPGCPVYLSPMDEYDEDKNQANRRAVAANAVQYGYIAGLQLHKYFGID